ncbi:AAA family ATPase [Aureibaculum sp. 2210JD6-5]|uniref:AAA family ATPase n=1 Tax=Aureibaculum sp. 2210JD6-5 TaxID=3103957 RepID=UPI002AAE5A36|nr:AAA family ATPase [Aureibaculum sp. 2210JD6-5]MDY7395158.1 AAA family ATPase [Aureibaculum sp. 2210JD6-5]
MASNLKPQTNKIVITGGPGTGKTTLINELERRNFVCIPEISRQITLQARANGIEYLFLENPLLFSELLLEGREKQYLESLKLDAEIIFFDRGIPDIHAYMNHTATEYPKTYLEKSKTYLYDKIFLLPPWKEIYKTDNERYESFDSAIELHHHLKSAYSELGYKVTEIPIGNVDFRVDYILKKLERN